MPEANLQEAPQESRTAGLEPLLLTSLTPIKVGNRKVILRALTLSDMFQLKRILREAAGWGGFEMGQKFGALISSLGNLGQTAGLLLTPLMGIPEIEGMFTGWLGDVFWIVEENERPAEKPYLPLGPDGVGNIPLGDLYPLFSAVVRHPDFESFFGQLKDQNQELISKVQTILNSFLPKSTEPGNEESISSKPATQETPIK